MKVLLFSFFALLCILFSCQPSPKAQDGGEEDAQEEFVDTTPKATAIFWIDKHKEMPGQSSKRPGGGTYRESQSQYPFGRAYRSTFVCETAERIYKKLYKSPS